MPALGVDISDISRFENQESLAKRILSEEEYALYLAKADKASFLAGRFSAKEAYVKASQDKTLDYREIAVLNDETGKPHLYIQKKEVSCLISISHDKCAIAVVLLYEGGMNDNE